ncbi:hypothetical protein BH24DEI2_BH24DEI2_23580 [soil metagenome]
MAGEKKLSALYLPGSLAPLPCYTLAMMNRMLSQGVSSRLRWLFVFLTLSLASFGLGQSLWLETGLAYRETPPDGYAAGLKVGLRGVLDLTDTVGLYVAPYYLQGFGVDGGVWFSFPVGLNDVQGMTSYLGAGLTLVHGDFGFALSGAVGFELSRDLELVLVYTHRPIILPRLSQTFDVSLGLKVDF